MTDNYTQNDGGPAAEQKLLDRIAALEAELAAAEKRGWNAGIDAASDSLLPNDGRGLQNLSPLHFAYERIRSLVKS